MAKKKKETEAPIIENISLTPLDALMGDRFGQYAREVIQDRAIPDARDGLKPVQRRILFGMYEAGNTIEKPTKKCAHIVGDVMGNYHPHGDSSIYEALVNMSQKWKMRMPLIDFQGNNGSIDGDGAAAYRYTEARLSALAGELIRDLDKEAVPMGLTFDDTRLEPIVLPARFPNLMVNGTEGIAVGISTNIPPHNLGEIVKAISYRIKHPNCSVEDLIHYVPGPDFPTGGIIYPNEASKEIYRSGKGKIRVGSKCECVVNEDGQKQIIITEIPYRVNKSDLVKSIDELRIKKTIQGIEEIRDETDKHGMRIAIDIQNNADSEAILKYLLNKTDLSISYSAQMYAIYEDKPFLLNLASYCDCYIQHQLEVISRVSKFNLDKDTARLLIVEGLIHAIDILDEVIQTIRKSENKIDAKNNLIERFGFEVAQADAILNMPLYKLSHTDIETLQAEKKALDEEIAYLTELLSNQDLREDVIIKDLNAIVKKYGEKRRTEIDEETTIAPVDARSLIIPEDTMLVATRECYIKKSTIKSWRGSNGHNGAKPGMKQGDSLVFNAQVRTTDFLLLFTTGGNYVYIPVSDIKDNKWNDEGFHVSTLVPLAPGENIVSAMVVKPDGWREDLFVVMASKTGMIKRVTLASLQPIRKSKPIVGIKLKNDELVSAVLTSGNSDIFIISAEGKGLFYNENDIPLTNPKSGGVKIGNFKGKDIASILAFSPDEKSKILIITDRCHTRVFDLKNIEKTSRLSKTTTTIFNSFQKEPHKVIYIDKLGDKEAPFTYTAVLHDDANWSVTFSDFYLTPMEKYAKKPETFQTKARLIYVFDENSLIVDKNTKSYEPPVKEISVDRERPEIEDDPTGDFVEFEQISLFDDEVN